MNAVIQEMTAEARAAVVARAEAWLAEWAPELREGPQCEDLDLIRDLLAALTASPPSQEPKR